MPLFEHIASLPRAFRVVLLGALAAFAILGAHAATAAALGKPTATTGAGQDVTATSATLTGSVNPNGSTTTYYFEYWTTTAHVMKTAPASAGSGNTSTNVSVPVGSLSPNTTYHFRLDAQNALGTAQGSDATFKTPRGNPVLATGGTTSVTTTSATLTGAVNPEGQSTTYYFEYGTTTAYGVMTPSASAGQDSTTVRVSASIGSLSPSTTYHYRIVAANMFGTTQGVDKTFMTAALQPPTATTGGSTSVTATSATLGGTVNP